MWDEGALVVNGFAMFAKQMFSFRGHQTPGFALPAWKSEIPLSCSHVLSNSVVSKENEEGWRGRAVGAEGTGCLRDVV